MPIEGYRAIEQQFLHQAGVERSTMMGFPCLRANGEFFAAIEPKTDHLIVKLHEQRVAELVDDGIGDPFAPNGRVFREWVKIPDFDAKRWAALMAEAQRFAAS